MKRTSHVVRVIAVVVALLLAGLMLTVRPSGMSIASAQSATTTVAPLNFFTWFLCFFFKIGCAPTSTTTTRPATTTTRPGATTTTSPSGDPVIGAAGDIACEPTSWFFNGGEGTGTNCRQKASSDLVVNGQVTRVLTLGDAQYESGEIANFQQSYDPTWGRVKNITHPSPGNHEYYTAGASGYYDYFGAAAGDRSKGYYSFNLGAWHLIALNSEIDVAAGSAQEQWLRSDLAANGSARCTLAYWHTPRFSSGAHGSNAKYDALWQALYSGNADVILNGHDHDYERFAPQAPAGSADPARGIRQFVVGTGGKELRGFGLFPVANSEVRDSATVGVLKVTLHSNSYDWKFQPIAGQSFTDTGTGQCH